MNTTDNPKTFWRTFKQVLIVILIIITLQVIVAIAAFVGTLLYSFAIAHG